VDDEFDCRLLHPLLASRFSPACFDAGHEISADEVDALLEAARWAPSAGNSQPWAFIVGIRGDDAHARLVQHLAPSSKRWAPSASALVANLSHRFVEGTDWEYSDFSLYDLGQAVAHMTIEAQALGLAARQFRAFDQAGLTAEFAVPDHWEVTTMAAYGRSAGERAEAVAEPTPAARDTTRERRPRDELIWRQS
jgi:nitroreductase